MIFLYITLFSNIKIILKQLKSQKLILFYSSLFFLIDPLVFIELNTKSATKPKTTNQFKFLSKKLLKNQDLLLIVSKINSNISFGIKLKKSKTRSCI